MLLLFLFFAAFRYIDGDGNACVSSDGLVSKLGAVDMLRHTHRHTHTRNGHRHTYTCHAFIPDVKAITVALYISPKFRCMIFHFKWTTSWYRYFSHFIFVRYRYDTSVEYCHFLFCFLSSKISTCEEIIHWVQK